MKLIPDSENAVVVRTDYSNDADWAKLVAIMREPEEPFFFDMEIVESPEYDGLSLEQLLDRIPEDYPHSFIAIGDRAAISQPGFPILVVDLLEERGRTFRSLASEIASIENNLSIANMGFEEYAEAVDENGVFRGFSKL